MDMWGALHAGDAGAGARGGRKIVFDRFHVMGYLGKAVDTVRSRSIAR